LLASGQVSLVFISKSASNRLLLIASVPSLAVNSKGYLSSNMKVGGKMPRYEMLERK
jgi:hypothetical protein